MANSNQLGEYPVDGGDLPMGNYSGSDIAANVGVVFDASNPEALFTAPGIKLPAAGTGTLVKQAGITIEPIKNGRVGRVRTAGAARALASGTIATGDKVTIENVTPKMGRVRVAAAAEAQIGTALNDALDGDPVLVLIQPARNA